MKRAVRLLLATAVSALAACGPSEPRATTPRTSTAASCDKEGEVLPDTAALGRKVVAVCAPPDVVKTLKTTVGMELTESGLRKDLVALHETGLYEDIVANARASAGGIALFVDVRERPRVNKVDVEGTSVANVTVKKAASPTGLHPGQIYDPVYAHERSEALRMMYVEEGFEDVTVTPKTTKNPDGTVDVHVVVVEGTRSLVGKVSFSGNSKIPESDLRKASEIVEGAPVARGLDEHASLLLNALYFDRGFVQVRVDVARGKKESDGKVPFTFTIVEGDVFRFAKVEIRPSDDLAKKALPKLKTKSGAVFSRSVVAADMKALETAYAEAGKKVSVEPETPLDAKKKTLDLVFVVREK